MHAERSEDVANVVADGLDAEVQLARDAFGRTSTLEQSEHLGLTWRQVRMGWARGGLLDVGDLAEHADHPVVLTQRGGADLHGDAVPVGTDHHELRIRRAGFP